MTTESEGIERLREAAAKLDGAGMPWAVFAGAAASAYGADRPLTDVDILVPAAEGQRLMALFPGVEPIFYQRGMMALQMPGVDLLAGLGSVDLDGPMAARLTRHEIGGVQVPVIPPEDNILLKGMQGRGAEQGKHDWEDVEAMMAFVPSLDWEYLRWRVSTLDRPELAQQVMERLEELWLRLRGEEREVPRE
jgi:hypothetical protein